MKITNKARNKLLPVLEYQETMGIRLYFVGLDKRGLNFGMSLEEPQPTDDIQMVNGIPVAIEKGIEKYTKHLVLKYKNERKGFVIVKRNW
jgi:Fe-S cluster assembly iron-binding protein IscA